MHLTIYVEEGCLGCNRAKQIGHDIQRSSDSLHVEVVDLADVEFVPDSVIAVPAYVLDGRLVSLGNPYISDLVALIEAGTSAVEGGREPYGD